MDFLAGMFELARGGGVRACGRIVRGCGEELVKLRLLCPRKRCDKGDPLLLFSKDNASANAMQGLVGARGRG